LRAGRRYLCFRYRPVERCHGRIRLPADGRSRVGISISG
jgi:hypothetical protein